jgi:hypothetical protein
MEKYELPDVAAAGQAPLFAARQIADRQVSPDWCPRRTEKCPSSDGLPNRLVSSPAQIRRTDTPVACAWRLALKMAEMDAAQTAAVSIEHRIAQYSAHCCFRGFGKL